MWKNRDLIEITDFTRKDIEILFKQADIFLETRLAPLKILEGKIMATAFFEPSTRTRLSFEAAMHRLGGSVIGFSSTAGTSMEKGESPEDTIRMLDTYSDVIVIRHPGEGVMEGFARLAKQPLINAGEGQTNHPTQALVDLYTIIKEKGKIEGLEYGVMGDVKHARTVKDFIKGLSIFGIREITVVSPKKLAPDESFVKSIEWRGIKLNHYEKIEDVISRLDVLYLVRLQVERFSNLREAKEFKGSYILTLEKLKSAKKDLRILHPLPRTEELPSEVDNTPYAAYFKQVFYSIPVRMAILSLILTDIERVQEGLI
ncbi:MAG: aspartate carbamoyltransferase [Crenarchaeota archaeon]|nr:aspartate carbamoyltransferase [Thermoproteota archaeon]MDW8033551.1 aspartate carbamoyltransferase [Nitrososphaerota archaeon]